MVKEALLFTVQGLGPQDIVCYYNQLNCIDPELTQKWMGLVQDALDKVVPDDTYSVLESLSSEEWSSCRQDLKKTSIVQPVVYGLNMVAYDLLKGQLNPQYVAGYSVGKYSALVAAGVVDSETMLQIVTYSGRFMHEVGSEDAFHTSSMENAARNLMQVLIQRKNKFGKIKIPLVDDLTGEVIKKRVYPFTRLVNSMTNPVRWVQVMDTLRSRGVDSLVEIRPGTFLQGIVKVPQAAFLNLTN